MGFEDLLTGCKSALQRFVYYKLPVKADADDVIQEICLRAYQKFDTLRDKSVFKAWILGIARNACSDYFRQKAKQLEIPLESVSESVLAQSRSGLREISAVRETLDALGDKDKQILYLYYFRELPQADIAKRLGVPVGTVKSRLHTARANFKEHYPFPPKEAKGAKAMLNFPDILPEYKIAKSNKTPFSVRWEENLGMFIVPRVGEKINWAMYDFPARNLTGLDEVEAVSKAVVHGVEGVEITSVWHDPNAKNSDRTEHSYVIQMTDTHISYLAERYLKNGVRHYLTFLDGDEFLDEWGMGKDNCGKEINIAPKGLIQRDGNTVTCEHPNEALDVVGRYTLTLAEKVYDTICVMFLDDGVATEQFLDPNGRTILWRRFNRDDWALERYKQRWTERFPENERLTINGRTFVHWYDCITDYIL
ncbi:MAG TPA: RNA polymerase sigma factor [Oscillospiraceae bacterium]|nr:RNA polymerase sigma factor [Oscillospiraceae bacterium]HPK36260.1 RNA polymerase sigma factor [Oscillospiraceae bacterium]HPR75277.1 RNA polymerase sigma factor [Oscillospiraceae bacterium]